MHLTLAMMCWSLQAETGPSGTAIHPSIQPAIHASMHPSIRPSSRPSMCGVTVDAGFGISAMVAVCMCWATTSEVCTVPASMYVCSLMCWSVLQGWRVCSCTVTASFQDHQILYHTHKHTHVHALIHVHVCCTDYQSVGPGIRDVPADTDWYVAVHGCMLKTHSYVHAWMHRTHRPGAVSAL